MQIPYRRADGPLNLLVDSTGIKFLGDGEWQARKRGVQGRCQWRKPQLAMDTSGESHRMRRVFTFDQKFIKAAQKEGIEGVGEP